MGLDVGQVTDGLGSATVTCMLGMGTHIGARKQWGIGAWVGARKQRGNAWGMMDVRTCWEHAVCVMFPDAGYPDCLFARLYPLA